MLYSGIDLHKRLIVICTVNTEGTVVARARMKTESDAVVECTSNWYWLCDLLRSLGIIVVLAHARYLKAISYAKVKTDAIDAHTLAQLLRMGFVPEAHQLPPEYRAMRDLLRQRMVMEHKRTNLMLRITSILAKFNITDLPMGMTFRGFLHRLCGVATVFLGGYHILYCAFTERGRGIIKDMIPGLKDAIDLWETLKNNFFINRPAKELKMPRFNFREKLEYLGLIWGTLVMTVTGFILWFKTEWLQFFPMWTWDVARAIHFYEAILATLTIIVWHFYSVIFNPDIYPMSWAWITGNLT